MFDIEYHNKKSLILSEYEYHFVEIFKNNSNKVEKMKELLSVYDYEMIIVDIVFKKYNIDKKISNDILERYVYKEMII